MFRLLGSMFRLILKCLYFFDCYDLFGMSRPKTDLVDLKRFQNNTKSLKIRQKYKNIDEESQKIQVSRALDGWFPFGPVWVQFGPGPGCQ